VIGYVTVCAATHATGPRDTVCTSNLSNAGSNVMVVGGSVSQEKADIAHLHNVYRSE
jgi:hypothetical protein